MQIIEAVNHAAFKHKKGKGWPSNWKTAIVYPGADAEGNPGKIVWEPWGTMIFVR